jgi:Tfp pilus assembly protein PilF
VSLYRQGQYDRAVVVAKKALQAAEQNVGHNQPNVAMSLNNLALVDQTQGQYAQAERLYKRSLAILRKNFATNDLIPLAYKN